MAQERIQKILARAGLASRRAAEELISSGRVKVNGRTVTELGAKANPRSDRIEVDGKLITAERPIYVLFHKPRGVVCTMSDPEGRPTVAQYVADVDQRIVPVGRLDFQTSGVLLMTNDGDFAAALAHPSKRVEKIYVAKLRGVLDDAAIEALGSPITIDGKQTQPAQVRRLRVEGDKTWVEFTLHEGRNRQIHRITEAAGSAVFRLARLRFAGLTTDGLRPGQWRYLTKDELRAFKAEYGAPKKVAAPPMPPTEDKLARTRQRVENIRTGDKRRALDKGKSTKPENDAARSVRRDERQAASATSVAKRSVRREAPTGTRRRVSPKQAQATAEGGETSRTVRPQRPRKKVRSRR